MNVFKSEIIDGVSESVKSCNSIAYCTQASLCDSHSKENQLFVDKIKAESANPKQLDLFYIKSILVSTGWNKNDDVFSPEQTWNARNTPKDKQFNFMHNENDIIGHITGSYVVSKEGVKIDQDVQPEDFDIVTESVLYNSWTDPENRSRMQKIISEIEDGKWFVSMECLFSGFDYAIIDGEGKAKVLARNEDSAFLTKHLRAYGGTGEYEGHKIGRSLKDISFSGKGLVLKPANTRSIILDSSRAFSVDSKQTSLNSFKGDNKMADNNLLEKQLAELQSELTSAKEENSNMKKKIEEKKDKEYADTIASFEKAIADKDEVINSLEASIKDLQTTLAKSEEDMKEKMEELNKMKKEKKMEARKAALLDLGFEAEEAEESVASYESFDDATFEAIIAAMTKMEKKKAAVKKDEEEDKEKAAMPKKNMAEEAEAEAEEAVEDALAEIETTEATLVDASDEEDEIQATRASVAEWLENNVLNK